MLWWGSKRVMPETLSQGSDRDFKAESDRARSSRFFREMSKEQHREIMRQVSPEMGLRVDFNTQFLVIGVYLKHNPPKLEQVKGLYREIKANGGFKTYRQFFPNDQSDGLENEKRLRFIEELDKKVRKLWQSLESLCIKRDNTNESSSNIDEPSNYNKIQSFFEIYKEINKMLGRDESIRGAWDAPERVN